MNVYDVIKKPILSEKSETLRAENVYLFEIDRRANKKAVSEAMQKIYGVSPRKINISYIPEREKRARYKLGYVARRKKAFVFLDKKDKIEIFEGV